MHIPFEDLKVFGVAHKISINLKNQAWNQSWAFRKYMRDVKSKHKIVSNLNRYGFGCKLASEFVSEGKIVD